MTATTLYDKIWDAHLVHDEPGEAAVSTSTATRARGDEPAGFEGLRLANRKVRRPELTLAVADHNVPTTDRSKGIADPESALQVATLEKNREGIAITYFAMRHPQGIVHIVGPEQGMTLPGQTIVCGDSHTSTHGAFGALASASAPAKSNTCWQRKRSKRAQKNMALPSTGQLAPAYRDIIDHRSSARDPVLGTRASDPPSIEGRRRSGNIRSKRMRPRRPDRARMKQRFNYLRRPCAKAAVEGAMLTTGAFGAFACQHVLDFAGADAEGERAEGRVSRCGCRRRRSFGRAASCLVPGRRCGRYLGGCRPSPK